MEDGDRGGPRRQVSDDELLQIFRKSTDPVLTASEIADEVSIGRRAVYKRLRQLEEIDRVTSKKVGGRTTVWWVAEEAGNESH